MLTLVFSEIDWATHYFWKDLDKKHFLHQETLAKKRKRLYISLLSEIDKAIAEILVCCGKDTNVILMSDHGFGKQEHCFALNLWLKKKGYLKIKKRPLRNLKNIFFKTLGGIIRTIPKKIKIYKKIFPQKMRSGIGEKIASSAENNPSLFIDYKKSKAFALDHNVAFGGIYLKKKTLREKIKRELVSDLKKSNLKVTTYNPQEIYKGPKKELAPEIIFSINDWECLIDAATLSGPIVKKESSFWLSGLHKETGVFVASGPEIKKGKKIRGARIIDLFPTILSFFDCPVPRDIDGKILHSIFVQKKEEKKEESQELEGVRI